MSIEEETSELINLIFTLQDRLQFFWNFYFGTVLALIAFIGSYSSGVRKFRANYLPKFAVTMIFLMFVVGNFDGLWTYAHLANDAALRLGTLVRQTPNISEASQIVAAIRFRFSAVGAVIGHTIGDLIVLSAIWFYLNPKEKQN
jgi:hypothetical protein